MSISSIPLEIVTEIVSHLETSFDGYILEETIEVGKSISLVSRAFRPIGQALRWRSITIALRSTPSLARHFETYPHLAKLVRFFHQLDHVEDSQRSLRGLVGVLTETRELRGLVVGGKLEGTFEEVFKIASSLQRLETFALDLLGMCRWTPELVAALLGGFPHLRRLLFSTGGTVTREDHQEDHHLLASNHWSPKRLAHLDLSVGTENMSPHHRYGGRINVPKSITLFAVMEAGSSLCIRLRTREVLRTRDSTSSTTIPSVAHVQGGVFRWE
ncbi:hypothetical protein JCM5350_008327 [Sporobolomyces pararoseus]